MANMFERAKQQRRAAMLAAESLTDAQAAEVPTLYPDWEAGQTVAAGDRRYYPATDKLYKCRQVHTAQADWTPDATPAMWEVIDVEHAGTQDDPIPAVLNMEYMEGKYYSEGGKLYRCTRSTGQAVAYLPSQLVGQYFEEAA